MSEGRMMLLPPENLSGRRGDLTSSELRGEDSRMGKTKFQGKKK